MKTPEQITREAATSYLARNEINYDGDPVVEFAWGLGDLVTYEAGLVKLVEHAIEIDRAQRGLVDAVAEVLDDRGAASAAQLVRDTDPDDDLWNNYLGPMLDGLEDDYTRMAKEEDEQCST